MSDLVYVACSVRGRVTDMPPMSVVSKEGDMIKSEIRRRSVCGASRSWRCGKIEICELNDATLFVLFL